MPDELTYKQTVSSQVAITLLKKSGMVLDQRDALTFIAGAIAGAQMDVDAPKILELFQNAMPEDLTITLHANVVAMAITFDTLMETDAWANMEAELNAK